LSNKETLATLVLLLDFKPNKEGYRPTLEEVKAITDVSVLPVTMEPPVFQDPKFALKAQDKNSIYKQSPPPLPPAT